MERNSNNFELPFKYKSMRLLTMFVSFVTLLLTCCFTPNSEQSVQDPKCVIETTTQDSDVAINTDLKKISADDFVVERHCYGKSSTFNFDIIICKLIEDTLIISASEGFMPINAFDILVVNGIYKTEFWVHNCTFSHKYSIQNSSLTLNRKKFAEGDSIIGLFSCQAIYTLDSVKRKLDTFSIRGNFKLKIRSRNFDIDSFSTERNYNKMLTELSNPFPEKITDISLSYCGLTDLPVELEKFKNLEFLWMEGNNFSHADLSKLSKFRKLKILDLRNCHISKLPSSIGVLKNLESLNLAGNYISHLPKGLFQLTNLKRIELAFNKLTYIPDDIRKLKKLEMLDISGEHNNIKKLPRNFFKVLTNLTEFYPPDSMNKTEYKDYDQKKNPLNL